MTKTALGPRPLLCPMPVVLVGAMVDGKANYCTVAYCGIVNHQPPMISIALATTHHTTVGIRDAGVFSVNIPSVNMVAVTDYCGLVSGKQTDKSNLFTTFPGTLNVPLIAECPINLECQIHQALHPCAAETVFIGEIMQVYAGDDYLTDGEVDLAKIQPFAFSWDNRYWSLGEPIGVAWEIGKTYRK